MNPLTRRVMVGLFVVGLAAAACGGSSGTASGGNQHESAAPASNSAPPHNAAAQDDGAAVMTGVVTNPGTGGTPYAGSPSGASVGSPNNQAVATLSPDSTRTAQNLAAALPGPATDTVHIGVFLIDKPGFLLCNVPIGQQTCTDTHSLQIPPATLFYVGITGNVLPKSFTFGFELASG